MTYGQYPPQQDPAGWGQPGYPSGYPAQPGWDQQPPQYAGGYPGMPGPGLPPQPPKSNTGVVVAVVLGVAVVLAAVVGVVAIKGRDQSPSEASATSTTTAAPRTTSAPPTSAPTTTVPSASGSGQLSYTEFGHNWDFKLGDTQLHADWVDGRDHTGCGDIETGGKLTGLGCQYAAEMVYKAEGGALMLTQFIIGMSDAAKATAAHGQFTDKDMKLRPGSYLKGFATGKWRDSSQKEFLVITLATATDAVDEATVKKYLQYRHSDITTALLFR